MLEINSDFKGWIRIPSTRIDYPILQSDEQNPEYYLKKNFFKEYDYAGSLFLDHKSSIHKKSNSKNLVIHGHNMKSTNNMFHELLEYNHIEFYNERPMIYFDTIYSKNQYKIFALFKTNGSSKSEELFDYTIADFKDDSEFLNFLYQIKIRSIFDYRIDLNETDDILLLSTCSYEVDNYRTIIAARKIRKNESTNINITDAIYNPDPLYPNSWYEKYGGEPPIYPNSFEKALDMGYINWYYPNNKD